MDRQKTYKGDWRAWALGGAVWGLVAAVLNSGDGDAVQPIFTVGVGAAMGVLAMRVWYLVRDR